MAEKKIIINKTLKRYEDDLKKRDDEYKAYKAVAVKVNEEYAEQKNEYDNQIQLINGECISLRKVMGPICEFLNDIGGNGIQKVTPFDFVDEKQAPDMNIEYVEPAKDPDFEKRQNPIESVLLTVSRNGSNKDNLDDFETRINNMKEDCDKDLQERSNLTKNIKIATDIAQEYLHTLVSVSDAIQNDILPEMDFITAFMYADAINKKLPELAASDTLKLLKVSDYEGTKYNKYFQFIKTSVDFFTLCESFFTKTPLTDIMSDRKVTDEELRNFEEGMEKINNSKDNLKGMRRD